MSADKLSSGQKQLFSLARAMLRRKTRQHRNRASTSGLLLIDELNSRLDDETDRLIQDVIREDFAGYTVIAIAHNLHMVVNICDRVLVLDKGEVVEADDPRLLVASKQSQFSKLYHGALGDGGT